MMLEAAKEIIEGFSYFYFFFLAEQLEPFFFGQGLILLLSFPSLCKHTSLVWRNKEAFGGGVFAAPASTSESFPLFLFSPRRQQMFKGGSSVRDLTLSPSFPSFLLLSSFLDRPVSIKLPSQALKEGGASSPFLPSLCSTASHI